MTIECTDVLFVMRKFADDLTLYALDALDAGERLAIENT